MDLAKSKEDLIFFEPIVADTIQVSPIKLISYNMQRSLFDEVMKRYVTNR